VFTI
jgi:hypothetical protein